MAKKVEVKKAAPKKAAPKKAEVKKAEVKKAAPRKKAEEKDFTEETKNFPINIFGSHVLENLKKLSALNAERMQQLN